jgi:hypothetical protein
LRNVWFRPPARDRTVPETGERQLPEFLRQPAAAILECDFLTVEALWLRRFYVSRAFGACCATDGWYSPKVGSRSTTPAGTRASSQGQGRGGHLLDLRRTVDDLDDPPVADHVVPRMLGGCDEISNLRLQPIVQRPQRRGLPGWTEARRNPASTAACGKRQMRD